MTGIYIDSVDSTPVYIRHPILGHFMGFYKNHFSITKFLMKNVIFRYTVDLVLL